MICAVFLIFIAQAQTLEELQSKIDAIEQASSSARNMKQYEELLHQTDSIINDLNQNDLERSRLAAQINYVRATLHMRNGQLDQGITEAQKSIQLYEFNNLKNSESYLASIRILGILNIYKGDLDEALTLFIQTKDLSRTILGDTSQMYARSVMNLGSLYWERRELDEALESFRDAEPLIKRRHGDDSKDYGLYLLNVGNVYSDLSDYENGLNAYHRAHELLEEHLGNDHPHVLLILNNLGTIYESIGNYERAEVFYQQSLAGRLRVFGDNHRDYFQSLGNVARIQKAAGHIDKAIENQEKILIIYEKNGSADTYKGLGNRIDLASSYMRIDEYKKAETLLLDAVSVFEASDEKVQHDYYANALQNLANLYGKLYEYSDAEKYYLRVLNLRDTILGRYHADYISTATTLVGHYLSLEQYDKAKPLVADVFDTADEYSRHNNRDLKRMSLWKATLLLEDQKYAEAYIFLEQYFNYRKNLILNSSQFQSQEELTYVLSEQTVVLDNCLNLAQQYGKYDPRFYELAYDQLLLRKGFILETLLNRIYHNKDSTSEAHISRWRSLNKQIADQYLLPPDQRVGIQELEEQIGLVERDLSSNSSSFSNKMNSWQWQEIKNTLQPEEAAIEFIRYRVHDKHILFDSFHYAAISILPNMEHLSFTYLGSEEALNHILSSARDEDIRSIIDRQYGNGAANGLLYDFMWSKILPQLEDVVRIYFSPSGQLHLINHNAIAIDERENLGDRYDLRRFGSTREVLNLNQQSENVKEIVLFGDVDYDAELESRTLSEEILAVANIGIDGENNLKGLRNNQPDFWSPLDYTKNEIFSIKRIAENTNLSCAIFDKAKATEAAFMAIDKRRANVLHVATHGYFYSKQNSLKTQTEPYADMAYNDHPLIRSGIILAGANRSRRSATTFIEGRNDGLVTAYEISTSDMSNTELVVLSACETGLGDLDASEGVYGLQRAFKLAGAKKVIMSLWQVPDYHTKELMIQFYSNWLEQKMSIREALTAAQRYMREEGYEAYYWAGFALLE